MDKTGLLLVNPLDGNYVQQYLFNELSGDYKTGFGREIIIDGQSYIIPSNFHISSLLFDTDTALEFYFTNSLSGEFKSLSATKTPVQ